MSYKQNSMMLSKHSYSYHRPEENTGFDFHITFKLYKKKASQFIFQFQI